MILANISKLKPSTIRSMTRAIHATSLTPQMFQPQLDVAYEYHLLAHRINAADLIAK